MSTETIEFILADIMAFHDSLENAFLLSTGIRQLDLLESAVHVPFQTFGGTDLYPTIYDKAAQLCYGICNNHPFVDGNKRTAVHSMLVFLRIHDIKIEYTLLEMETIIIAIASSKMTAEELAIWLQQHSKTII